MMLPYLRTGGRRRAVSDRLGGLCLIDEYLNGSLGGGDRLSSDQSPGLCQRRPPRLAAAYQSPQAIWAGERLIIISKNRVYLDGSDIGGVTAGQKQTAYACGRVVIFPDKLYVDLKKGWLMPMEKTWQVKGASFASGSITAKGTGWPFEAGDGVEISGCTSLSRNNLSLIVRGVDGDRLIFDENVFDTGSESGTITVKRRVPQLNVMCESGNRLWGCEGDTIYSSKLGDPLNFFVYDGLATDSYALKTGEGGFTACGQYGSHVIFFRESSACKLYGTRPANYQLMTARIPGVRRGCGGTLWVDSEDMYYLGVDGVYAYSGGVPQLLSFELGAIEADSACGGAWNGKYYLSLKKDGRGRTLSYDIIRRQWLPWGGETACGMAVYNGSMYMLEDGGGLLQLDAGEGGEEWSAEFRPFRDAGNRLMSGISLVIDARPEEGAWLAVDIKYGGGPYFQAAMFDSSQKGPRPVPLPPNRSGELGVRLRGFGRCPVYTIERIFRTGSEMQ